MNNEVRFKDYSMLVGQKQDVDWYEWCVFVNEDKDTLSKIRSVEYTLHPTFPNPIRRVTDRATRFALFSSGWGGFGIAIEIDWQDGLSTKTRHFLHLASNKWPKKQATEFESAEIEQVYRALFHDKFRWRKTETVQKATGIPETRLVQILRKLQDADLIRKADFFSIDNKELWAPTAIVGLSPHL